MVHKSLTRSNSVASASKRFSCRTHHFVVDIVGGVCNMEHIPQNVRLLMAREVKQ